MLNKLLLLGVTGLISTSVHAGVTIQCHNTPNENPVKFIINESAGGYNITAINASPMPESTHYSTRTNEAGITQARITLINNTETTNTEFAMYYPSVHKEISHHPMSGDKYEVPSLYNNFTVIPANPDAILDVTNDKSKSMNGGITMYIVTSYNLASIRYWSDHRGYLFHGCFIVNTAY